MTAAQGSGYDDLAARWATVMMDNYGTPPVALVRGEGATVWDADGREYVDLIAGIAVSALGHAHPELRAAVDKQMSTLGHVSNLFMTEPGVLLAERLLALLGTEEGRVFFANSGAEANEAALKIARRHGRDAGGEDKLEVVAATGSFHGRTFGALAVTGQPAKRTPFEPLPGPVTFVPYGDIDALRAAVTGRTAAVILEPVLGEGGVRPAPKGYLLAARQVTRDKDALLVVDEVQTGIGRTGAWFAHVAHGLVGRDAPDVVTLAKGLGGGLPIGACVGLGPAGRALRKGDHGTTYGGNPVVSAAALAVLDVIASDGLLEHVRAVGARLVDGIRTVDSSLVADVRGSGLLLAFVLGRPVAPAVELAARQAGFLVNAVAPDAVRLAPPLVLSAVQADAFVAALPGILSAAERASESAAGA